MDKDKKMYLKQRVSLSDGIQQAKCKDFILKVNFPEALTLRTFVNIPQNN